MKFQVELISDNRVLVTDPDGTITVVTDEELGAFLRPRWPIARKKRAYPKGTRKRRTAKTEPTTTAGGGDL